MSTNAEKNTKIALKRIKVDIKRIGNEPQIIIIVSIMDLRKRKVVLQIPAEKQMCKQNEHDRFYPI